MLDSIYELFVHLATWPTATLLIFLLLICIQAFAARSEVLGRVAILDSRFLGYSPDDVRSLFEKMGGCGRRVYARSEITLDLIFPFVYGGLLIVLLVNLITSPIAKYVALVPALTAIFDWIENALIAYLAWNFSHPGFEKQINPLTQIASVATVAKNVLACSSVLIVMTSALGRIFNVLWIMRVIEGAS